MSQACGESVSKSDFCRTHWARSVVPVLPDCVFGELVLRYIVPNLQPEAEHYKMDDNPGAEPVPSRLHCNDEPWHGVVDDRVEPHKD